MLHPGPRRLCLAFAIVAVLWTARIFACNVPVFRYALERWEADPYEIVVFHRDPLSASQQACIDMLEQAYQDGSANVLVNVANVSGDLPPARRALWNLQQNPSLPWMVVRYPRKARIEPSAWTGPCTAETVRPLLDSPVRQDIARKLLRGDTAVWLLLESGDPKVDQDTFARVEAELRHLEQTLVLPKPAENDPPMASELPLKIAFSTVRVAKSNPAERALVELLLNAHPNLASTNEPMLFPIFGRGRAISPAVGGEIRPEALRDMAEFLTGPCSCEIKEMNPGFDLLLAANWKSLPAYQETPIPTGSLVGLSQFAANATNTPAPAAPSKPVPPVAITHTPPSPPQAAPTPSQPAPLVRNLALVFGAGVLFAIVATLFLRAGAGRGPQ